MIANSHQDRATNTPQQSRGLTLGELVIAIGILMVSAAIVTQGTGP